MTNWYWPDKPWLAWKIVNFLLNLTAKIIWFKEANANIHDEWYKKGGTEADRIWCDTWFLRRLLVDANWIWYKTIAAYLFYFAVRLLWKSSFNYNDK